MNLFGIEITGARIIGAAILAMTVWGGFEVYAMVIALAAKMAA